MLRKRAASRRPDIVVSTNPPIAIEVKGLTGDLRNIVVHQFSPEALAGKISALPPEEKVILQRLLKALRLGTTTELADYLLNSIGKLARPGDRQLLSPALMEKTTHITKLSYGQEIAEFKAKCDETTTDLYQLVMESLRALWVTRYSKEGAYRNFEIYKDFERILFKDPRYRDHFIHQFQVFLAGLPIMEVFHDDVVETYSRVFSKSNPVRVDLAWLLAATFHDIGYLVQQFDKWLASFFTEFLDIESLPVTVDLWQLLLKRNFQEYADRLASLHKSLYDPKLSRNWRYSAPQVVDHEFRKILLSKLVSDRNHGVISSLILMDRIEHSATQQYSLNKDRLFTSTIMPAGLAIALHDTEVFSHKGMRTVDFAKDPLTFTLIFCDTIQEWGRPITPGPMGPEYAPRLSDYEVTEESVRATLAYDKVVEVPTEGGNKTTFALKDEEIRSVIRRLRSDSPHFEIALQSLDKDHPENERNYKSLT